MPRGDAAVPRFPGCRDLMAEICQQRGRSPATVQTALKRGVVTVRVHRLLPCRTTGSILDDIDLACRL